MCHLAYKEPPPPPPQPHNQNHALLPKFQNERHGLPPGSQIPPRLGAAGAAEPPSQTPEPPSQTPPRREGEGVGRRPRHPLPPRPGRVGRRPRRRQHSRPECVGRRPGPHRPRPGRTGHCPPHHHQGEGCMEGGRIGGHEGYSATSSGSRRGASSMQLRLTHRRRRRGGGGGEQPLHHEAPHPPGHGEVPLFSAPVASARGRNAVLHP